MLAYHKIGASSAARTAAEMIPSVIRSRAKTEPFDGTAGVAGMRLGSAPSDAGIACGGDIAAASVIAFAASTVP